MDSFQQKKMDRGLAFFERRFSFHNHDLFIWHLCPQAAVYYAIIIFIHKILVKLCDDSALIP